MMKSAVMSSAFVALGLMASSTAKADESKFYAETQFGTGTAGSLAYQVIPNLYVGAGLGFGSSTAKDKDKNGLSNSSYAVSPHVSYALGLSDNLVLWPRVGVTISGASADVLAADKAVESQAQGSTTNTLDLSLPVLVKASSFFFGPSLDYSMGIGSTRTVGTTKTTLEGSSSSFGLSFRAGLAF
jgi:hypothetical protein